MQVLKLDYQHMLDFVSKKEIEAMEQIANQAKKTLLEGTGPGNGFLGWVDANNIISQSQIEEIKKASQEIRKTSQVLVVVGIGGSYLGAKAAIQMLNSYFSRDSLEIVFLGNTLSSTYTSDLLDYLKDKDFSINVISKSGTTTEPAIAFRLLKKLLNEKYGSDANKRIYVTTDPKSGALRQQTELHKYTSFEIPANIGGRYSVLTAVGLLPIACSGIDIEAMLQGAKDASAHFHAAEFKNNEALIYASIRNLLYKKDKTIELFVSYEPNQRYFSEWLKQLFGESEGKDGKGLFPASIIYSTDLHSMGQFVQDGTKTLFETTIKFNSPLKDITFETEEDDSDGLNYLSGMTMDYVNSQAQKAVVHAHKSGNVGSLIINLGDVNSYNFGYLVYFFMFSCAISGYILGVNPFDQEGVEAYKKNMFALLGKKGYEKLRNELLENAKI